ncbi:hypothetical protein KKD62_01150 [Patescibacteria group bacterium]|nr:hypothetical protein [Patescibacteria group bacterium]MBU1931419.1 hypothetical protein [Patescibacteria group bacterium]
MKSNKLTVWINKPVDEIFRFCITPPNSTRWIPSVTKEETSEFPIRIGTVYTLQNKNGNFSEVTVTGIKKNEFVEWISKDKNYHCRYLFKPLDRNTSEFEYYEWIEKGELEEPFTIDILEKLKRVIEQTGK